MADHRGGAFWCFPIGADLQPAAGIYWRHAGVWRGQQELRRFPYAEWQSWRLFAPWLPGLFYFREIKSIHFLPILFNPAELRQQLEQRVGSLETPKP